MAEIHGSPGAAPQMPAIPGAGTEPVPYAGPDLSPEPPLYAPPVFPLRPPGADVMAGVSGAMGVKESGYARDIASATAAPYYPGYPSPIVTGGGDDPGGRDVAEPTIAGAVAAAEARYLEYQKDTFGAGSVIGDLMDIPPVPANALPPSQQPGLYPYQGDEPASVG